MFDFNFDLIETFLYAIKINSIKNAKKQQNKQE